MNQPSSTKTPGGIRPLILLILTLVALFLINSGLSGSNPFAFLCLMACFAFTGRHDKRLLAAIMVPLGILALAVVLHDLTFSPVVQLVDAKYVLMALVFGGGFGYIIILTIRNIEATRVFGILALFSAAHAIWALIFVRYAPIDINVSVQGFTMQRQNILGMQLLRFWTYDNQVIGITYFTVLPVACSWAAFQSRRMWVSAALLAVSALLGLYCSAQFVTRIPLVAWLCAGGAFLLHVFFSASWSKRFSLIAIFLTLLIGGAAYISQTASIIVQEYINRFTNAAEFSRLTIWKNAINLIANNSTGGVRETFLIDFYAHNCFLDWLIDFGWVIGGLFSITFIGYFGWVAVFFIKQVRAMDPVLVFMILWSIGMGTTILIDPPTYSRMLYLITSSIVVLGLAIPKAGAQGRRGPSALRVRSASKLTAAALR